MASVTSQLPATAFPLLQSRIAATRGLSAMTKASRKLVAVLPEAGDASNNPDYLNCSENGLGLRELMKDKDFDVVITADKEGPESEFERNIPDAEIIVTTPFHPGQVTRERLQKAKKLKLVLTAGIGSDHIDYHYCSEKGITCAEVQGSNNVSVAEDEVLRILLLVRNFLPAWKQIQNKEWNVPKTAVKSLDLQGKTVGTVGGGRIGYETMLRLKPFGCKIVYFGRREKPDMKKIGADLYTDLDKFLAECDVVTINLPLSDKTHGMFNAETLKKMKKGAYLVNNARGAIVDAQAVADACNNGQLGGYSGDVWNVQPPPEDHPWWHMKNNAMTAHTSGTTLDAQKRYQEGVHTMIKQYLNMEEFQEDYYIVRNGELAGSYQ